jgi:hypothetical protein
MSRHNLSWTLPGASLLSRSWLASLGDLMRLTATQVTRSTKKRAIGSPFMVRSSTCLRDETAGSFLSRQFPCGVNHLHVIPPKWKAPPHSFQLSQLHYQLPATSFPPQGLRELYQILHILDTCLGMSPSPPLAKAPCSNCRGKRSSRVWRPLLMPTK